MDFVKLGPVVYSKFPHAGRGAVQAGDSDDFGAIRAGAAGLTLDTKGFWRWVASRPNLHHGKLCIRQKKAMPARRRGRHWSDIGRLAQARLKTDLPAYS